MLLSRRGVQPGRARPHNDGVVVVVVIGEHDVYTAPSLRDQIQSVIEEKVPFIVDLTPATFVDSSILRVLLEARRQAEEQGLGFAVALGDGRRTGAFVGSSRSRA